MSGFESWSPGVMALVAAVFLVAGLVKGLVGMGLPATSVALLAATLGLQQAMALMVAPSLFANLWQSASGGHLRALLARMWPFLVALVPMVWVGAALLPVIGAAAPSLLLAVVLWTYAFLGWRAPRVPAMGRREAWLAPLLGLLNGLVTGLTATFVLPGLIYLHSLGLRRDHLIQAMGILFTVSTAAIGLALGGLDQYSHDLVVLSLLSVVPTWIGMVAGRRLRRRLSDARFRQCYFAALAVLGAWIALKVIWGHAGGF